VDVCEFGMNLQGNRRNRKMRLSERARANLSAILKNSVTLRRPQPFTGVGELQSLHLKDKYGATESGQEGRKGNKLWIQRRAIVVAEESRGA
jgi:hypothetical protein